MNMENSLYLKVRRWNLKGVNNVIKIKTILNILKRDNIQIALLQETHLNNKEHQKLCRDWVGQMYYYYFSTKSCGVCILLHKNLPGYGKYSDPLKCFTLYCNNVILGSDFNCFLNPTMDKSPSVTFAPQVSSLICDACYEQNLLDIWRFHNRTSKEFTFFSHPHQTASRIDYIFTSCNMAHLVSQADIGSITISDHAPVTISIRLIDSPKTYYFWKLKPYYLMDDLFVEYLKEKTDYYFLCNDLEETDPRVLWDAYKAYIRGMIFSYVSKKNKDIVEKQISHLQRQYYISKSEDVLTQIKHIWTLLNNLLTARAERDVLFARQRLFEMGNKPNCLLAKLIKNRPGKKCISAVRDGEGRMCTDDKEMNNVFRQFYVELYSSEGNPYSLKDSSF
uniref:exodeoxyribonuclease III n=1 Tax=Sinocyclocheilus rhinocerous TaxID=307959 RepID=A0A673LI30_9TELE